MNTCINTVIVRDGRKKRNERKKERKMLVYKRY